MDWGALQQRMVDAIGDLIQIESPSSNQDACIAVAEHMQEILVGWLGSPGSIERPGGQPLVRWGDPQPKVLLLGHLDTVWPIGTLQRIPWQVSEGRMTGPGVFDMKAGVMIAVAAVHLLSNTDGVGILMTTDEEVGSKQSRSAIADACSSAVAALVFEPSADASYKTRRKGTSWYDITFHGRAAHAGLEPEAGVNALLAAAFFAIDAATWTNPPAGTTVTPTTVRAGTTPNTVPDHAHLTLDVRAWNKDEQLRVDEALRAWRPTPQQIEVDVSGGIDRPALESDATRDLFERARACAQRLGFGELTEAAVGGASDGNLTAALGVPTLDGMGAVGAGAHADHEWASVADLVPRSRIAAALIEQLL